MPDKIEQIKAVLQELSTSSLTCSARLVAVIHALGIDDPKTIESLTGLGESGARKAKRQLKEHRDHSPAPECRDTPVPHQSVGSDTRVSVAGYSLARTDITTHANNEYPSDIVIPIASKLAAREAVSEIEGLNGSTSRYVDWLAGWLNEFAPDHQTARAILQSNIEIYGPDKVRAGMVELKTMIAGGDKPRNLAKAFPAFIKNATTEARPKPEFKNKVEQKAAAFESAMQEVFG